MLEASREESLRKAIAHLDAAALNPSDVRNRAGRALCGLASLAVNLTDTPEGARTLLASYDGRRLVQRFVEASEHCHGALLDNPKTGPTPDGGMAANGPSSIVVHLAWLLEEHEAAARMIEIALDPVVVTRLPKARFWDAYFTALRGVARKSPFELPKLELRGLEKYWFSCMQLAAAVATRVGEAPLVAAAQTEFERLNRDKRITDWLAVDGDGRAPVKWSLRIASLLETAPAKLAGR